MLIFKPLKSFGVALFLITVLGTGLDQWITLNMENQLMSPDGAGTGIWIYGALSLLLNLSYPMIFLLLVIAGLSDQKWMTFFHQNWSPALREEMRVWGQSMLWSLALIIPGMIQFLRLVFVPFIVALDPAYAANKIDALEKSQQIARGKLGRIFGLFILFSLVIPGLMTNFDAHKLLWKTPLSALLICFIEMILNLCFILGLWKLYSQEKSA